MLQGCMRPSDIIVVNDASQSGSAYRKRKRGIIISVTDFSESAAEMCSTYILHDSRTSGSTGGSSAGPCASVGAGMAYLSRMLLCGVLSCFEPEDQLQMVCYVAEAAEGEWHRSAHQEVQKGGEEGGAGAGAIQVQVHLSQVLRCLLLTVHGEAAAVLLRRVCTMIDTARGRGLCVEQLLAALPVRFLLAEGGPQAAEVLLGFVEASSSALEKEANKPSKVVTETSFFAVGDAISFLCACTGITDSAAVSHHIEGLAGDTPQLRAQLARCTALASSTAASTSLLRWISSLAHHVSVLVPASATSTATATATATAAAAASMSSAAVSDARLVRVEALAVSIHALAKCLWGRTLPGGVQQVLLKAALHCATAAASLTATAAAATAAGRGAVYTLFDVVATIVQIVNGKSFSEASFEVNNFVPFVFPLVSHYCLLFLPFWFGFRA
jgi:hypothetical protein